MGSFGFCQIFEIQWRDQNSNHDSEKEDNAGPDGKIDGIDGRAKASDHGQSASLKSYVLKGLSHDYTLIQTEIKLFKN